MTEVTIGDCRLILGDCRDVLPTLGKFDLLLTEPPYGIGCDETIHATKPDRPSTWAKNKKYENMGWDSGRPDEIVFLKMQESCRSCIIWGGNYFADFLPAQRAWLFWDKQFENTNNFSHGELARTTLDGQLKKFTLSSKAETRGGKDRVHPTQKPVGLFKWCIGLDKNNPQTILDPFMGSGTTGVACANMGRKFTGIEREPKYFDIACKRIEDAYRQQRLFA